MYGVGCGYGICYVIRYVVVVWCDLYCVGFCYVWIVWVFCGLGFWWVVCLFVIGNVGKIVEYCWWVSLVFLVLWNGCCLVCWFIVLCWICVWVNCVVDGWFFLESVWSWWVLLCVVLVWSVLVVVGFFNIFVLMS